MKHNGFGETINRLCKERNMNKTQFGELCGLDKSVVTRICKGEAHSVTMVKRILKHFPRSEAERAELERELILDRATPYFPLSPLLEIQARTSSTTSIDQMLKRAGTSEELKAALPVLIETAMLNPELVKILSNHAKLIKRWEKSDKTYTQKNAETDLPLAAESRPAKKKKAKKKAAPKRKPKR